ncbi:MAG: ATPase [Bacteroidales bacterium]
MIIIADSGSTKAEWVVVRDGAPEDPVFSGGINPYFLSAEEINELLNSELNILAGIPVNKIWFYGTGCNTPDKNELVRASLGKFFTTDDIFIGSDLLGAARSLCHTEPGIACILGTGSNSCYYDGTRIVSNVPALGFILGDEGSAAIMGRKLLSDILKRQLPQQVIDLFHETYNLTQAEILDRVYREAFPSRFLGSFSRFLSDNIKIPELEQIVVSSFDEFIVRNILQYSEATKCLIHFTGSVAYHFRDILANCLGKYGLKQGKITASPMDELIKYHIEQL